MKSTEKMKEKRMYQSPEIVCVELDKEVSLALESTPPAGPEEGYLKMPENFNNKSFDTSIC